MSKPKTGTRPWLPKDWMEAHPYEPDYDAWETWFHAELCKTAVGVLMHEVLAEAFPVEMTPLYEIMCDLADRSATETTKGTRDE